jgi:hypothetical protein
MKTLKVSLAATIVSISAWWFRLPQKIWPAHPYLADFLMTLALCVVLMRTWSDPKSEPKK